MIKVVFAWKHHPDISAAECERHYRAVHMPLARQAFQGVAGFKLLRYNRVRRAAVNDHNRRELRSVEPDVDAWVELYFDSEASMQQAFARPELEAQFEDHKHFMAVDTPANIRVYFVDEEVILAS